MRLCFIAHIRQGGYIQIRHSPTARSNNLALPIYYNISAKADKFKLGAAITAGSNKFGSANLL
jgi:hypothetical protein